jgi:sugar phosphate isomerase/epimerase
MALPPVGMQPIVLGKKYSIESAEVLDHVAKCGYAAVESGGGGDAAAFKKMLDARGLRCSGLHLSPKGLLDVKPLIERLRVLDSRDVCNSGLMDWNKRSADDYAECIKVLNDAGRKLRAKGIRLHYHNHAFEFDAVESQAKTGMDLFLAGLDFGAVDLCVDVGWVKKANLDPAAFLLKHKDKVGYLHFKDFDEVGWTELGRGVVDWHAVMGAMPELKGARWTIIEQDTSRIDPLESVAIGRAYLKQTFGY